MRYSEKQINQGKENLKLSRFDLIDKDRQREIASLGGKTSTKKKKELRQIKDILTEILTRDLTREEVLNILGHSVEDNSMYSVLLNKLTDAYIQSDGNNVKMLEFIRDSVGQKPTDTVKIDANVITDNDRQLLKILTDKVESDGESDI